MAKYILSLDIGGTYIKAGIYDLQGEQLGLSRRYNHLLRPESNRTEYDPDALWGTACLCMYEALKNSGIAREAVAVIGISAQGSGCYFMGEHGETIRNFISSADSRSRAIVERWQRDGTQEALFPYICRYGSCSHTDAILAWLKEYEPQTYSRMRWIFTMKDYLVYRMTGEIIAGRGCMSCTGLLDLRTGEYDSFLAHKMGIPEIHNKLPPLKWDTEIGGRLTHSAAKACGCLPGTPVACGSHDVIATAFAMDCIDSRFCFVIMGTSSINAYISKELVLDGSVRFNELFAEPGRYLIEQPGVVSSSILEWVIDLLFDREKSDTAHIYSEINRLVSSIAPEENALVFLPYVRGFDEMPDARAAWLGLTQEHTRAHLLEAVYEAVVYAHMIDLEQIFRSRTMPERIKLGGGATNSPVWTQMFADAVGIPVEVLPNVEMGTKGAAIVAAVAAELYPDSATAIQAMTASGKIIRPDPARHAIYQNKYARFKTVLQMSSAVWKAM